ncbi:GTPase-activating protein CdGAPr isoform X3 [Plutella xylostella]|nr:GTPase-activating protein CdGAPr isoform X3 [Plutella xylostella]
MSCQSLAARAYSDPAADMTHCAGFHRSVRFSSESRSSTRASHNEAHTSDKRENSGSISLVALSVSPVTSQASVMSQSAPAPQTHSDDDAPPPAPAACRFPKLEECAHFHYERVSLGGLSIETMPCPQDHHSDCDDGEGWICIKVRSHVVRGADGADSGGEHEWSLSRNKEMLLQLDDMLHRCIYDRKVSGLPDLSAEMPASVTTSLETYRSLIADYLHHLSIIADDALNCGPVLNWLQMDNKGHKLLVANEDCNSINTPAVAAAYSVRKYVSQARDEISFEVGDMISIIDMPGPQESLWWRGKRGFRVGFFPHHCVAVIGDKVPRHMTQPPPIVGSVAVAPIKPVLRKHGKLISLFRSFILSRPSRRSLKQQGILRERVFGCDLGEHLLNCGHTVPLVLVECARVIEERGAVDGIYRLSGGSGLTQRLRAAFDSGSTPDLAAPPVARDPHALASLLKMYFRELPNPLCTYQLYNSFVSSVQAGTDEADRIASMRRTIVKLPPPHYRTLAYLMQHLRRVSSLHAQTGMTPRNMAIVWAPNLLRSPAAHALHGIAQQAVVTEFLICYAQQLFSSDQDPDCGEEPALPSFTHAHHLLDLEEAQRRGRANVSISAVPALPPPSGAIAAAAATILKPETDHKTNYIEVGSGPNNLPQYHTILELPAPGAKRGLKRSPSGWRGLFSRSKQRPRRAPPPPAPAACTDIPMVSSPSLRPVKSCESLQSESDTVSPLRDRPTAPLKQHTRSASCDSYFEAWQAELAGMRVRLAPQERDRRMFSEEHGPGSLSLCSSPLSSEPCSAEPSPRRAHADVHQEPAERKRCAIEDELASIAYIDGGDSPRAQPPPAKELSSAKRLCKDRDSPKASISDFQSATVNVKLRERNSPRKARYSTRYSGLHHPVSGLTSELSNHDRPVTVNQNGRLTWHGKDGHSTLIKIDWPQENSSISNLTSSTINSSPVTPVTPIYDQLESDSEVSEANNKHTIKITENKNCDNCHKEKCLKCELKATDYEHLKADFKIGQPVTSKSSSNDAIQLHDSLEPSPVHSTDISYQNLNRLSAISTSSNSEHNSHKKELEHAVLDRKSVMTSSHESSSSYSNPSKQDDLYEPYTFTRPNYINLHSSSTSKSSPSSPLKSPLKSTISITFRSPTKSAKTPDYELIENTETPTNERDSVYEDIDLEKNLSIVEDASIPDTDASLPTQQACQPDSFNQDLIILETPTEQYQNDADVYSQVKFFKKSIEEVNAMMFEAPEKPVSRYYENVSFPAKSVRSNNDYENINVETLRICDKDAETSNDNSDLIKDKGESDVEVTVENINGNVVKKQKQKNLNVRELATRFESPTEQKSPFSFEKFKAEIKYPTLERKDEDKVELRQKDKPTVSPKSFRLSKHSTSARSLDENAFIQEFGSEKVKDKRKSLEPADVKKRDKFLPDLNLNLEETHTKTESITPTTENKISLIQRFEKPDLKNIIGFETEKKLSRERIEKYKEERRNFLREKYSSQSFRSNPEHLTRIKIKKDSESDKDDCDRLKDDEPKFERRNTVDLGQRMRFSLAKSDNSLDTIQSPDGDRTVELGEACGTYDADAMREFDRTEKVSPSYNIRDMAAMFEQKSQNSGTG